MHILFINANLYGHINPTLGLVKKLVKRGNRVSYFCAEEFAESVRETGAAWIGFGNGLTSFFSTYRPTDNHPFFRLIEYMLLYDEIVLPEIIEMTKQEEYDAIICDSYFGGVCFLRQMTAIPVISSHSSFAMSHTPVPPRMLVPGFHPQLDYCSQILKRICETLKIKEPSITEVFVSKGDLNVVYTTKQFNGDENIHEPDYLFAGPSLDRKQAEDFTFSETSGRKVIYISLGSVNTKFLDFYQMCIQAFQNQPYEVYLSIGKKLSVAQLGKIPANFTVKEFMPQLTVLEHADLFITHAGFNSVNEALYFGVPMLTVPQVNDQHMIAKRLSEMNLGCVANIAELTPELLLLKAEEMLTDAKWKENSMKISREMRETADLSQTTEKLERFINTWEGRNGNAE